MTTEEYSAKLSEWYEKGRQAERDIQAFKEKVSFENLLNAKPATLTSGSAVLFGNGNIAHATLKSRSETFQQWLSRKGITLKKKDYSKQYQRYRYETKKKKS